MILFTDLVLNNGQLVKSIMKYIFTTHFIASTMHPTDFIAVNTVIFHLPGECLDEGQVHFTKATRSI